MTEPDTPEPSESADQIPRHTTPTWEVEMIISGAAVFAMLQLPGWLDQRIGLLIPRFNYAWAGMLTMLSIYWICAAVVLAITFTVHLSLRAHWSALVGTHSVFPDGIRWHALRSGPAQSDVTRERLGSINEAIERADNRATIVFAVGVSLASFMILLSIAGALLFPMLMATQLFTDSNPIYPLLLLVAVPLMMVPYALANYHDRKAGAQLPDGSRKRRLLTRTFKAYANIGIGRHSYAWTLLSSRIGKRRQKVLVAIILVAVGSLVSFMTIPINAPNMLGNYGLFPYAANTSRALPSAYYDDERDITRSKAAPYIPSEVITGPYLRLVVPWQPTNDNAAVKRGCATALALSDADARVASTLDCLAKLHAVSIDGKPLSELRYDAGSDPRTQRPALVAMIDVRTLAPGRHQLDVRRAPRPHPEAAVDIQLLGTPIHLKRDHQRGPYVIPFWR